MKLAKFTVETNVDKLHAVSTEVKTEEERKLLSRVLLDAFKALDGKLQGLAAIQCGYASRAVLLRYVKGEEPIVIFNPVVLIKIGFRMSEERCLSEGVYSYRVKRPMWVKVKYDTLTEADVTEWLPYKKARIFMHEYDHLNGVLLQDRGRRLESSKYVNAVISKGNFFSRKKH